MYYVVVDIGYLNDDEDSNIVGIFTNKEKALKAIEQYEKQGLGEQHTIEMFEVEEVDRVYNIA